MIRFPDPDLRLAHLARRNLIHRVETGQAGPRLDKFLAAVTDLPRALIRDLIEFGSVWVAGRVCRRQSRLLAAGEWVTLQAPAYGPVRFYEINPARIVFQDDWLLAYDKEAGLPCQQTPYDGYNHLYGALGRHLGPKAYLALHHRLDGPTSGVMLFALRREVNQGLSRLFKYGPLIKLYLAVTASAPAGEEWTVDRPIAKAKGFYHCPPDGSGKPARTEFKVLARGPGRTLLQARPLTGRTHQIRLHLAASGHPVLGDAEHGGPPAPRLMLHAASLSFTHPRTGRPLTIEAPRPPGFDHEE
ncbi:MAG: RluA family pseudouridine synthase [Thermodesulfobacteriota bacterium]